MIEGTAFWWTHPAPSGKGEPVLSYQPGIAEYASRVENPNPPPTVYTPLPEIAAKAIPTLRCTTGVAARIDNDDGTQLHLAFFEWDHSSSASVLEAFKHLPDECMGSIGMRLVEHGKPRIFEVGRERLPFDHTTFLDHAGVITHAFRGTWVSGLTRLLGEGERGGAEEWRQIRWKAAAMRFRPAHARVAQGAVRGIPSPDLAWQAFEEAMLTHLKFESQRTVSLVAP